MRCLFALVLILTTHSAFSANSVSSMRPQRAVTVEPCAIWWYDFDLRSYVCQRKGSRLNLYTSAEVERIVADLESKIAQLDSRLKALEAKQ